ncbi:hypothetical protein DL95DRAFT_452656 [Leptodontidium sp. 2 PMI_412]|nr:hypothetical protein BKA61DRAFT_102237 [Leptodontidium sp. MPI-SDFR-AT-0119]KAH9224929.1 hypothetical protein DL95DRAFT_452656 [Leptodontidium sp. 2 PMI_412]
MGPLLTPTTELFYAFVNLDDTPVPRDDVPEEDVFARAFKQATVAPQLLSSKNDPNASADVDSSEDSPQDLIFDDFLSKELDGSGDTSPSSAGSSSTKPPFNTSNHSTTPSNHPPVRNGEQFDGRCLAAEQLVSQPPRPAIGGNRVEVVETPQDYGQVMAVVGNNGPFLQANNFVVYPKQPRRRNTKRKLRTEEEEAARRAAFLERNRMAAQKCRSRKKRQTNTLEDDLAIQEEINMRLKVEVAELAAQMRSLKEVYLQCEQECQHAKAADGAAEEANEGTEMKVDEEEIDFEPAETVASPELKEETVEAMDVS